MTVEEIANRYRKPVVIWTKESVQKNVVLDKLDITGETSSNETIVPAILKNLKEEKAGLLKDFVLKNSAWASFVGGITAGQEKETLTYLEQVKANMQKMTNNKGIHDKTYRKISNKHLLAEIAENTATSNLFHGFFFGGIWAVISFFCHNSLALTLGPMAAIISIGGITEAVSQKLSKKADSVKFDVIGERFMPMKNNNFLTIPPDNKKILCCQIAKDEVTGETYPQIIKSMNLPDEPASISYFKITTDTWNEFDNYEVKIKYENPDFNVKEKDVIHTKLGQS